MTSIKTLEQQLRGIQQSTRNVHDMLAEAYMHSTKLNATDENRARSEDLLHQSLAMMANFNTEFFTIMQHLSSMSDNYNAIAKTVTAALGSVDSSVVTGTTKDTAAG